MAWLTGWSNRVQCTIDGTVPGLGASVTNGIALVGVPAALKAVCQAAGQDLRFTAADGTTLLDYGIEDWSAAAPVCHVRVPTVATGNTIVYAYGGNAGASDAQNKSGVATDFAGYWPLGDAGPTYAYDWTANANTGEKVGTLTWGATGKVDGGISGANAGRLDLGDKDSLNSPATTHKLSLAAWVNPIDTTGYRSILAGGLGDASSARVPYDSYVEPGTNQLRFQHKDATGWYAVLSAGVFGVGVLTHFAVTFDDAAHEARIYWNGVPEAPQTLLGMITRSLNGNPAYQEQSIGGDPANGSRFNGVLDMLSLTDTIRSADQLAYAAKSYPGSSMFAFGALESVGGAWWHRNRIREQRRAVR